MKKIIDLRTAVTMTVSLLLACGADGWVNWILGGL